MTYSKPKIIVEGIAGAMVIAFTALFSPILRAFYHRWGATQAEYEGVLAGDEFVQHPKSRLTLAITIQAPPEYVWPWFAQLGCQRGGWYSYDLLDNGGVPSAERILPDYQQIAVGEIVKAVPNGSFGFPIAAIEPGKVLLLAGTLDTSTGQPADPNDPNLSTYYSGGQLFLIERLNDGGSRLIFRMRQDWNHSRMNTLIYRGVVEPISFVMGRKMLLNIKKRAETLAQQNKE